MLHVAVRDSVSQFGLVQSTVLSPFDMSLINIAVVVSNCWARQAFRELKRLNDTDSLRSDSVIQKLYPLKNQFWKRSFLAMVPKVPTIIARGGILIQLAQSVQLTKVGEVLFDAFALDLVWLNSLFKEPESYKLGVGLTGFHDV